MGQNNQLKYEYHRRYKRVYLSSSELDSDVWVMWPSGEKTSLSDMSLKGASFECPKEFSIKNCEKYSLQFQLGRARSCRIECEVMWFDQKRVGVQFDALSPESRRALDEFLSDRLIGTHLKEVDPQYFSAGLDCQYWYHGPDDVNVYLWTQKNQAGSETNVTKAIVELGEQVLVSESDQVTAGLGGVEGGIQSLYTESSDVVSGALPIKTEVLLSRVIHLLAQIPEPPQPMQKFLAKLSTLTHKGPLP